MRKEELLCVAGLIGMLGGCASDINYKEDKDQIKVGVELLKQEIPKGKAILEVTTNSYETVTITSQSGGTLCKPEVKTPIASVERQVKTTRAQNAALNTANVFTLGLAKTLNDPAKNQTPVTKYLYIESGKEQQLQAKSLFQYGVAGGGTGTSTCGPLYLKFVPEEGRHYKLSFISMPKECNISLATMGVAEQNKPAKHTRWFCTAPLLGIGGNEVFGVREIN